MLRLVRHTEAGGLVRRRDETGMVLSDVGTIVKTRERRFMDPRELLLDRCSGDDWGEALPLGTTQCCSRRSYDP